MSKQLVVLIVQFFFVINVICAKRGKAPSFIIPCSESDPNINECALKNGQFAIPSVLKGEPKFKFPNMLPLKVPEIKFSTGNLNIQLNNVDLFGFETTKLTQMKLDVKSRKALAVLTIDAVNLRSDYNIDGKILILPIQGNGRANLTFTKGEYRYSFDYDKVQKNGEEYLQMKNTKLDYEIERSYYNFENLFASGKTLGIDVNQFLNENWKDVQNDIGPALSETVNQIITSVLNGVFGTLPYDKIFLP